MDVRNFFDTNGLVEIPNPNYNARKKNSGPKTLIVDSFDPINSSPTVRTATKHFGDIWQGTEDEFEVFRQAGITPNRHDSVEDIQKALADQQSALAKFGNAALQTVGSEIILGTLLGVSDLVDFFINLGNDENDYTNPVSEALEKAQESFKAWAPIYTNPDVDIFNGGLLDAGWWASNLPSVASTLTLMIPGMGVSKGVSAAGKALKIDEMAGWTRRAMTGLKGFSKLNEAEKLARMESLGAASKWINGAGKDMFNKGLSDLINAGTMRVVENYQESKDTYRQMYNQAANQFNNMSDEEWNKYLERNPELTQKYNTTDRNELARAIAKESADRTFKIDMGNLLFDFIELRTLQDVGKLNKNVMQSAKVRKAERLAKLQAGIDAGVLEKDAIEKATTGIKNNIFNFISDHASAGKVVAGELSEGIEEAVNYVAQQEGIHYGNLMLENDKDTMFGDRMKSYMRSAELYESAFWGVMGGILFQSVGGNIQQAVNNTLGKSVANIKNQNNEDETGSLSTAWSRLWETATDKRQLEEINSRPELAAEVRRKLDMINNNQNPYETLEDNNTPAALTTNDEKALARKRVRDEYITDLTVKAVDSGNYDALISYLEDENVEASLKQQGVIDENSELSDKADVIAKVKEVAQKYQDNLFTVNTLAGAMKGGIPMEYQQIIARDNTYAKLKLSEIDARIAQYEGAIAHHSELYKKSLESKGVAVDEQLKRDIMLVEASQRLGELKAQRRAILVDTDSKDSINSQDMLRLIDRQIDAINKQLTNTDDTIANMSRLIWAHGYAERFNFDEALNKVTVNSTNEGFVKFADLFNNAVTSKNKNDVKALSDHLGINFEATDEQLLQLFGNGEDKGDYQLINERLQLLYPDSKKLKENRDKVKQGVKEAAPALHEDYINLSALEFAKIYEESQINETHTNISRRVQELDNYMNEKRVAAKNKAYVVLDKLEEKYGIDAVLNYLDNNKNGIEGISNKEKKQLDDALLILDLQKEANSSLFDEIKYRLINNMVTRAKHKANESQNSSTSEQSISGTQSEKVDNSSAESLEPSRKPANSPNEDETLEQPTEKGKGKLQLNSNLDGNIEGKLVADTEANDGVHYNEDADNNIHPEFSVTEADKLFRSSEDTFKKLFDVNESNETNDTTTTIVKQPVLKRNEDGTYDVVEKGQIEIKDNVAPEPQVSSTGEQESSLAPEGEGKIDEASEAFDNQVRNIYTQLAPAFGRIRKDPAFADKSPIEQLQAAVDTIKNDPSYDKDKDEKALEAATNTVIAALKTRGLDLDISNIVLHSTLTEKVNPVENTDYINAVDKLVQNYAKKYNLPIINGKVYVNLADVLRTINEEHNNTDIADLIYNQFVNYITSKVGQEKYVVTDKNPKSPSFINEIRSSLATRIAEVIGESSVHRVNIYKYLTDSKAQSVLKTLKKGDKVDISLGIKQILLTVNGTTIGNIPLATVLSTGGYSQINNGWITKVTKHNDEVSSNVKDALIQLYTDAKFNDTLNDIWQYTYDKSLSKEDKTKLVNKIYDVLKSNFNSSILDNAAPAEVVGFVSKTLDYVNATSGITNRTKKYVLASLDSLFESYYNSYELADRLNNDLVNGTGKAYSLTVEKRTQGQANHNGLIENDPGRTNYDRMSYINEAVDEEHKNGEQGFYLDLGYVTTDNVIKCKNRTIERGKLSGISGLKPGLPYLILSNGTEEEHIIATSIRLNDTNAKAAKPMLNAINKELDRLIENAKGDLTGKAWNNVVDFLWKLSGHKNSKWIANATLDKRFVDVVPLFTGLHWSTTGNGSYIHLENGQYNIQFNNNGEFLLREEVTETDETNTRTVRKFVTYNINETNGAAKFKEVLDSFKNSLIFDISSNFINQIPTGTDTNSFVTIGTNEFTVGIPNSETGEIESFVHNSFTDFAISNGVLKVDTHVGENGSNFESFGDNQNANQILTVRVTQNASSPVEDNEVTVTTNIEGTLNILKDSSIKDKATELVKDDFSEKALKSLKDNNLLPKNIIFDENYNVETVEDGVTHYDDKNAEADLKSKKVTLGKRWVAMFNETDEFSGANGQYRAQALRKLIHEQLHLRLDNKNKETYLNRIEEIYNDFKDAVSKISDADKKAKFEKYLFTDESREVALEEFLVESLTSSELVDYLNSVDAKFEKGKLKNNLWQKILKLLNDIFGWNIREGSLREKELYVLQKEITQIEKGAGKVKLDTEVKKAETSPTTSTEEASTQPKEEPKSKGLSIFGKGKSLRGSSITETINNSYPVSDLESFTEHLPLEEQPAFMRRINSAERTLTCSI